MKKIDKGILKKRYNYNLLLDKNDWLKLQELKRDYNLAVIFRKALREFYEENIEWKK